MVQVLDLAGNVTVFFFSGKTLKTHSVSLHSDVQKGASKFTAGDNLAMDKHPIQGGVEILLVASCH